MTAKADTNPLREALAKRIETSPLGWLPTVGDAMSVGFTPDEARVVIAALRSPPAPAGVVEALKAALPYLDNSDSPGGCNGRHKDCGHCAAIANSRAALASEPVAGTGRDGDLEKRAVKFCTTWGASPLHAKIMTAFAAKEIAALSAPPAPAGREDLAAKLLHAMTTMQNDDESPPMTEKRERLVRRYETMSEVLDYLRSGCSLTPHGRGADEDEYDPAYDEGITYAIEQLAELTGSKDWQLRDGSEDHATDVRDTIMDVLKCAGLYDEDTGKFTTPTPGDRAAVWQPIETAPKDGSWIIAISNDHRQVEHVYWEADQKAWYGHHGAYGDGLFAPCGGWIPAPAPKKLSQILADSLAPKGAA